MGIRRVEKRKKIKVLTNASVAKIVKAVTCKVKDRGSETHQRLSSISCFDETSVVSRKTHETF
jgi:hypothetical protein